MKKNPKSIDGFVRRHDGSSLGRRAERSTGNLSPQRGQIHTGDDTAGDISDKPTVSSLGTGSIRESLDAIDQATPPDKDEGRRQRRKRLRNRRNQISRKRRIIKRIAIVLLIIILGIAGYLGIRFLIASSNVFDGNLFGLVKNQPLKQDENGRSNFIVFGTAEDSEGGEHGGANLTDSLMVVSVNQEKKDAFLLSVPRDLWVDYGKACVAGYQGKINAVYMCGSNDGKDEEAGTNALRKKIGEVTGLDIQYYAHLNFTAVTELVDAVGGVDVKIESNPKGVGILDRNFDWRCQYRCHYVKYDDGQIAHLDGEHALALARARNAQGGYGLADSNFDREKNQQKIIKSLRKKALSAGTLTNISKVTSIFDAIGDNLQTNVTTAEVRTIVDISREMDNDKIRSLTLVDKETPLVQTGSVGAQSVVLPLASMFNYGEIKSYIQRKSSSQPSIREGAKLAVYNAGGEVGAAQKQADKLAAKGYKVTVVDNSPTIITQPWVVYRTHEGFSATTEALQQRFSVTARTTAPPVAVPETVDFVIMVGAQSS